MNQDQEETSSGTTSEDSKSTGTSSELRSNDSRSRGTSSGTTSGESKSTGTSSGTQVPMTQGQEELLQQHPQKTQNQLELHQDSGPMTQGQEELLQQHPSEDSKSTEMSSGLMSNDSRSRGNFIGKQLLRIQNQQACFLLQEPDYPDPERSPQDSNGFRSEFQLFQPEPVTVLQRSDQVQEWTSDGSGKNSSCSN